MKEQLIELNRKLCEAGLIDQDNFVTIQMHTDREIGLSIFPKNLTHKVAKAIRGLSGCQNVELSILPGGTAVINLTIGVNNETIQRGNRGLSGQEAPVLGKTG